MGWIDASSVMDSNMASPCLGCPEIDRLPKCIKGCTRRAAFLAADVPTIEAQDPAVRSKMMRRLVENCLR